MAPVKRLNYFTNQFLVEKDFKDEQDYHIAMRRRLNASLHTWGVAEGLVIARTGNRTVSIAPGMAIDNNGREIVVIDTMSYTLTTAAVSSDIWISVGYNETFDPADRYVSGAIDNYIRTTEVPQISESTSSVPKDGTVVTLARIHLDASGNIEPDGTPKPHTRR